MLRKLGLKLSDIELDLWFIKLRFGPRPEEPRPGGQQGGGAAIPAPNGNLPAANIVGSPFDLALRAVPRVDQLLRDIGCEHAANQTISCLLTGHPVLTKGEKDRVTYRDIREACLRLILETLQRYHQRATYGAVAGIVGGIAQAVMKDRPQDALHSWVVASENHLPTGYDPSARHPNLEDQAEVLDSAAQLRQWLANTQ